MSCVVVYDAVTLCVKLEREPIIADQQEVHHPGLMFTMRLRSRARSANQW
jgi:hypothetical protein